MVKEDKIIEISNKFNQLIKDQEQNFVKLISALETLKEYEYNLDLLKSEEWLKYLDSIKEEKTNEDYRKNAFNVLLADMNIYNNLKKNIRTQERLVKELDFERLRYRDLIRFHLNLLEVYKNVE